MIGFSAAAFAGRPEFGAYTDALGTAHGLEQAAGRLPAILFALALLDASIIGAAAVSLATAYAIGDVFAVAHSLHRKPSEAKGFYAVYAGLIAFAAALVVTPGMPLGLLTNAVQTLAGVLLPSATVFLLLLCNDKAVLGPWVNRRAGNLFTGAIVAVLVLLSVILTVSVLFPGVGETTILGILGGGVVGALLLSGAVALIARRGQGVRAEPPARSVVAVDDAVDIVEIADAFRQPQQALAVAHGLLRHRQREVQAPIDLRVRLAGQRAPHCRGEFAQVIDLAILDLADRRDGFDRGADHEARSIRALTVRAEAAAQGRADQRA